MNKPQKGFTLWLTGLPCAGKSTLAGHLAKELSGRGHDVEVMDGDVIRRHLSKGLGYSREDRDENIRRIAFVSRLLSSHGTVVIVAAISPYRAAREEARSSIDCFFEVYVKASIEACIRRDMKGLYKKALEGQISNFTGVDDPYEPPTNAEIVVHTETETPSASVGHILAKLEEMGLVVPCTHPPVTQENPR